MNIKNFISFIFLIQSTIAFPRRRRNRNGRENKIKTTQTTSSTAQATSFTTQTTSFTAQTTSFTTHTC